MGWLSEYLEYLNGYIIGEPATHCTIMMYLIRRYDILVKF